MKYLILVLGALSLSSCATPSYFGGSHGYQYSPPITNSGHPVGQEAFLKNLDLLESGEGVAAEYFHLLEPDYRKPLLSLRDEMAADFNGDVTGPEFVIRIASLQDARILKLLESAAAAACKKNPIYCSEKKTIDARSVNVAACENGDSKACMVIAAELDKAIPSYATPYYKKACSFGYQPGCALFEAANREAGEKRTREHLSAEMQVQRNFEADQLRAQQAEQRKALFFQSMQSRSTSCLSVPTRDYRGNIISTQTNCR